MAGLLIPIFISGLPQGSVFLTTGFKRFTGVHFGCTENHPRWLSGHLFAKGWGYFHFNFAHFWLLFLECVLFIAVFKISRSNDIEGGGAAWQ